MRGDDQEGIKWYEGGMLLSQQGAKDGNSQGSSLIWIVKRLTVACSFHTWHPLYQSVQTLNEAERVTGSVKSVNDELYRVVLHTARSFSSFILMSQFGSFSLSPFLLILILPSMHGSICPLAGLLNTAQGEGEWVLRGPPATLYWS